MLMCTNTIGFANQINMNNVRTISDRMKSEVLREDENETQNLDEPIDFETEGELSEEDLKKPLWVVIANKIVSPFFVMYNWFQSEE